MNLQNLPLEYLNISVRAYLALKRIGINRAGQILDLNLDTVRFLGSKTKEEIINALWTADDSTKYFDC